MSYTNLAKVKRLIQADAGKIKISQEELVEGQKEHISEATISELILDIDAKINVKLEAGGISASSYTTALGYVATRYVAYEVYRIIYPRVGVNEIPVAVSGWKKDADEIFEDLGKAKSRPAGATCEWNNL